MSDAAPEPSSSSPSPWPIFYACPACGAEVAAVAGDRAAILVCPRCGEQFVIASEEGSTDVPEEDRDAEARARLEEEHQRRRDELDGLKIRQLTVMRRAAHKSRWYCLIAAAACVVGAAQITYNAVLRARWFGWTPRPVLYFLGAAAFLYWAAFFLRKSQEFHREATAPALPEPTTPPDFSALSDGSQTVRNLEELGRSEEG